MKHILLLGGLFIGTIAFSQDIVYEEGFEGFEVGAFVSDSPDWITWTNNPGTDEDATILDVVAHGGNNSLWILQTDAAGGPMDVVMLAGLDGGVYDVSFWMYIDDADSGYYNFQESTTPGVAWAFEAFFSNDGTMTVAADGAEVASGAFPFGEWFLVSHLIDMDSDNITLSINGESAGNFLFDSAFGGINFFGTGDGTTTGQYFIDDITVATADPSIIECPAAELDFTFGPNPAVNFITIQGHPSTATLRIHALNGQLIREELLTGMDRGQRIDLNLENGIYFVELISGTERATRRLVISH